MIVIIHYHKIIYNNKINQIVYYPQTNKIHINHNNIVKNKIVNNNLIYNKIMIIRYLMK